MMDTSSNFIQFLSIVGMGASVIGILFLIMLPKDDRDRRIKAIGIFILGMSLLLLSFISKNPDILEAAEEHIALTLIGLVIATLSAIKIFRK